MHAPNTTWLLFACRVSLAVLLCCPGFATCCEQTFSPARPPHRRYWRQCHGIALARLSGCVFGKIWTSAPCRSHQEQHLFCGRGVWHAAGRISAGTCLQCAGIRVQKGVVCVCALARDRLSEMHACVHHVCVSDCTCLRGLVCVIA